MKILLAIAETPYINEWFSRVVQALSRPPYNVEFVLYFNSELAYRDKKHLFSNDLKTYKLGSAGPGEKAAIEIEQSWDLAYISWERQWHQKACTYDLDSIRRIVRDLHISISSAIDAERPDFVFYELPSSLLGEVLYHVCEASGYCKYLSITQSRIPDRIDICDDKYCFTAVNPPADEQLDEMLARLNDDFVGKRAVPSYMSDKTNASIHQVSVMGHYLGRLNRLRFYMSNLDLLLNGADYETREAYGMLLANLRNHLLRRIRKGTCKKHYVAPVPSERYVLFPLHLVPESSVSGQSMFFSDLVTTIRYIAFSLPLDVMLYVKAHPSAVGTRDRRFFREMAGIPNVRLISHEASNEELIRKSESVVTLSSTLGLEAALVGKPVFLLGDVFYQYHPMCIKVGSIRELREQIAVERRKPASAELLRANIAFWREYLAHTVPGNILNPDDDSDVGPLYRMLQGMG